MTCQECLYELATGSLRDLTPESEVARHCATCPDCGPLATLLRDREYNAATILNNLPPISNPIAVAEAAGMLSRRRRVGKVVVYLTGAALVATIWISLFVTDLGRKMITGDRATSLRTETFQLSCMSPEQAGALINPYVRSQGSAYYVSSSGVPVITVRGTADELSKSRELLRRFDNDRGSTCGSGAIAAKIREMQDAFRKAGMDGPGSGPVIAPKLSTK